MRTHESEEVRKAAYQGLRSVGPHVAGAQAVLEWLWGSAAGHLRARLLRGGRRACTASPVLHCLRQPALPTVACCPPLSCCCAVNPLQLQAEQFAEIVKLRNKLARVAGFKNYYAMKLEQAEGFGMDVSGRGAGLRVQRPHLG